MQNGYRKAPCAAGDNLVLDIILWKLLSKKKKVHLTFLDISKAYDSVDRAILWSKLSKNGIDEEFLGCL